MRPRTSKRSRNSEILYGRQPVQETLRARRRTVQRVYISRRVRPNPMIDSILELSRSAAAAVEQVDEHHLDRLTGTGNHQGVAVRASLYPYLDQHDLLALAGRPSAKGDFLGLMLDHVQDPQNLGSLLRTAEGAGTDVVVVPADRAAGVTPATVRASAGASEHIAVAQVVNLARVIRLMKETGIRFIGLENLPDALPYSDRDLTGPLFLILGSEGKGLSRLVREACDGLIRIPLHGRVESLNVGVAGGVVLYEAARQRSRSPA